MDIKQIPELYEDYISSEEAKALGLLHNWDCLTYNSDCLVYKVTDAIALIIPLIEGRHNVFRLRIYRTFAIRYVPATYFNLNAILENRLDEGKSYSDYANDVRLCAYSY